MGLFTNTQESLNRKFAKACWGADTDRALELLEQSVNLADSHYDKAHALYWAIKRADGTLVSKIVERLDINGLYNTHTPLQIAATYDRPTMIRLLISLGADINACTEKGSALHYAAISSNPDCIEVLLENNIDILLKDSEGHTAEHVALVHNNSKCASLLSRQTVDAQERGWTLVKPNRAVRKSEMPGYTFIDIFDFKDLLFTRIVRNNDSEHESQSTLPFSQFDDVRTLESAYAEFTRLGGKGDSPVHKVKLEKPKAQRAHA